MNQMGLSPSASCECGAASHAAQHIASECPLHSCNGDLVVLDTAARNWLRELQCERKSSIKRKKKTTVCVMCLKYIVSLYLRHCITLADDFPLNGYPASQI